jgi:two-component system, LytTR family, response regulator
MIAKPTAYLVDDEPLALRRLQRMLEATARVQIAGSATDPVDALEFLHQTPVDLLFVDIEMPGLTGFDLLRRLVRQPLVIFTTAYSQYALQAFEVHSVDYLLKPVDPTQLDRALNKIERILQGSEKAPDLNELAAKVAQAMQLQPAHQQKKFPARMPSRTGDKVEFVDIAKVTHFYASDKLTFASTAQKDFAIDFTITELETKLDPSLWIRIHRSTIVNVNSIQELHTWFGGKILLRLNDAKGTELAVSRDRAKDLKDRIGLP